MLGHIVPEFNRPDLREVIFRNYCMPTSCKTSRSLLFKSHIIHEVFSCVSAENLGILEAKVSIPWRLGYSFAITLGKEKYP